MRPNHHEEIILHSLEELREHLSNHHSLRNCTVQDVPINREEIFWDQIRIENTSFLGCHLSVEDELKLRSKGAFIYNKPAGLPYNPFRNKLYEWRELMEGWTQEEDKSIDLAIYHHFDQSRNNPPIIEALSQRIHDHSIDDCLRRLLEFNDSGLSKKKSVGVMGGHGTARTDEWYIKTAFTTKILAENGYFIVSGGGPGIMEAANLGAWFAGRENKELQEALKVMGTAPGYKDEGYFDTAMEVLEKYPDGGDSLAIPTWFYGHEPSNLFATHIAKYFSNSIREDTLLAICLHGIVFAPGSAGTTQEIFQDATQNHYGTYNYYSPMVFLSRDRYEIKTLIYPLLKQLAWGRAYQDLLFITDSPEEILPFLQKHPPIPKKD